MSNGSKCWIIEDSYSAQLIQLLSEFKSLNRPGFFQVILLNNIETKIKKFQSELNNIATVKDPILTSKFSDPTNLINYLTQNVKPNDLLLVDVKLNECFNHYPYGFEIVKRFIDSIEKKENEDKFREFKDKLKIVFTTLFPKEAFEQQFRYYNEIVHSFYHASQVSTIVKNAYFLDHLIPLIDEWRIKNSLKGDNPGPQLQNFLEGNIKIVPFFQPIINMKTGKIAKYEVLLRDYQKEKFPFLISKEAHLIGGIPEIKFNMMAIKVFLDFIRDQKNIKITGASYTLNISPNTLISKDFSDTFLDASNFFHQKNFFSPEKIGIEMVEKNVDDDDPKYIRQIRDKMKSFGYDFIIDDLGEGGAALNVINKYNPDIIKIDKKLMDDLVGKKKMKNIIAEIAKYAFSNNIKVVAEGIDDKYNYETIKFLINNNINMAQGYLFGKATNMPLEEIKKDPFKILKEVNCSRKLLIED